MKKQAYSEQIGFLKGNRRKRTNVSVNGITHLPEKDRAWNTIDFKGVVLSTMTTSTPLSLLAQERIKRHWTQVYVARMIGSTKVSVGRWERGTIRPSLYFRQKLCQLFERDEADLFGQTSQERQADHLSAPSSEGKAIYDPAIPRLLPLLLGREGEIQRIKEQLHDDSQILVLHGLPGVGKTAVATMLAHDESLHKEFRDGVLWARLGLRPNLGGILRGWGALFGVPSFGLSSPLKRNEEWRDMLRAIIGSRRLLVILDDAWGLEDVFSLLVGGFHCTYLVTTKFPHLATQLAVKSERIVAMKELGRQESMQLLRFLAPHVHQEAHLSALVTAVGGLPLALTLMGNYLRQHSYRASDRRIMTALERLGDAEVRLHLTENYPSLSEARPRSLQSVIAVIDQQLSTLARAALYALATFPAKPNTFSEEAALAVASCTEEILDDLTDTGLLENCGANRYTLHQVIADYARFHLKDQEGYENVYQRLIAYVNTFLMKEWKNQQCIERELTLILTSLDYAYEHKSYQDMMQITSHLLPVLTHTGNDTLAQHVAYRAYQAAEVEEEGELRQRFLLTLGEIAQRQGNAHLAKSYAQEGLRLAMQQASPAWIAQWHLLSAFEYIKQGNYQDAEYLLQEHIHMARMPEKEQLLGVLAFHMVLALRGQGRLQEALTVLDESTEHIQGKASPYETCLFFLGKGLVLRSLGETAKAYHCVFEAHELAREGTYYDRQVQFYILCTLADIAIDFSQEHVARKLIQNVEAVGLHEDPQAYATIIYLQARLFTKKGALKEALVLYRRSREILLKLGEQQQLQEMQHWMVALLPDGDLSLMA